MIYSFKNQNSVRIKGSFIMMQNNCEILHTYDLKCKQNLGIILHFKISIKLHMVNFR